MAGNGKTPYFGLDTVPVDGSFEENGNKAMVADRILVDSLLHSTINHRHNGLPIVPELVGSPPEVELDVYPGNILGGQTLYYAVSLIDENGKEGNISSSSAIVIPNAVSAPVGFSVAPSITGGDLLGGSYQYVLTAYGSSNPDNETEPSPAVYANVLPTTHGSVTITYPALPAGASGWNIYRHKFNEQDFLRISIVTAAEATSAGGVFVDDGSYEPETNKRLPTSNNTSRTNSVLLTFPDPIVPVGYTWKVYRTSIAGYWANSFLYHVVETDEEEDDAVVTTFLDTGFPQLQGSPIVDMPVIYNPGPLDIGTETVGTIPSTRIDHSSVVLEQVDGFVDIAYEDPANLYFVELSEPGSFLVPELEEERTFYLVLKVAEMATPDLSLPAMEWEVSDGAATPSFETLTPIWYGSNPFEEEEVPADGVMIQVSVVQTGPTARHLALVWLAGGTSVAAVEDLINFGTIMDFEVSETYFDSLVGVAPVGTRVTVYQVDAGDPMGLGIYEFAASSYTLVKDLFNGDYDGIFGYSTANVTDEAFTVGLSGFYSVNSLAGWPAERLTLASYFVRSEIPLSFTVPIKAEFDPDTGDGKDLVNKDAYDLLVARIELLEAEVFP